MRNTTSDDAYTLTTLDNGMVAVVKFEQENLNYYTAEVVRESLRSMIENPEISWSHLVLNLKEVRMLDSSGVGLFVSLRAIAEKNEVHLCLCEVGEYVGRVFAIMRVQQYLNIFATEGEAVRAQLG